MIKRRRDQGFTLIELMIVIAVIGILAIVLVPKVGTIKTQAKGAGIDTNVRMVQGYLQSKVSKWADQGATPAAVAKDVYNAFNSPPAGEKIKNPFSQKEVVTDKGGLSTSDYSANNDSDALQITTGTVAIPGGAGSTIVVLPSVNMSGSVSLTVYGLDNSGAIATTVKVTP